MSFLALDLRLAFSWFGRSRSRAPFSVVSARNENCVLARRHRVVGELVAQVVERERDRSPSASAFRSGLAVGESAAIAFGT